MKLQPIVYVTDMDRAISWYSTLLEVEPANASSHWTTFAIGDGTLALHYNDVALPGGSVDLSLVAPAPLESVSDRVPGAGGIDEQPFGRSLVVIDPDGTKIQVNEHNEPS